VVVIVPIAVGVPATIVLVPPLVLVGVAVFAGFAELVTGVFGLSAVPAMATGGLVELVIGFTQAALAGAFVGAESGYAYKEQCPG
jgi:hypothetical protein